jgi:hypothetical protein
MQAPQNNKLMMPELILLLHNPTKQKTDNKQEIILQKDANVIKSTKYMFKIATLHCKMKFKNCHMYNVLH